MTMPSISNKLRVLGLLSVAAVFSVSCGAILSSEVDDYELISGTLDDSSGDLKTTGSASLRFVDVSEVDSQHDLYSVGFKLDDGGSIEFSMQSNSGLTSGVDVMVSRDGQSYETLINGVSGGVDLGTASDDKTIELEIELDNASPRLLVWKTTRTTAAAAVFDSDQDDPGFDAGTGNRWGINMIGATITKAKKTAL